MNKAKVIGFVAVLLLSSDLWARGGLPDFTRLVEQHASAVVNISTTHKVESLPESIIPHMPPGSPPMEDFLRRFFGDKYGGHGGGGHGGGNNESLGSGFIVSKEGYILTNHHVVDDAEEIIVRLSDRREYLAVVIGSDKRSDVAVLKIDPEEALPVIKIGKSSEVKVGEWVLAIGSPFGFDHTVTAGIVSALGRNLPNESYVPFIQTDVAINPGNSGGPLFNLDGEVIGMNSQIYSRTGGFMGLSFSIPIDMAMNIAEQLKQSGVVKRGWLGILIQDVTRELAESFGMKRPIGALVAKILPDSPAEKGGLQVGDVIVEFNGQHVGSSSQLPPMVGSSKIDKPSSVKVMRNGRHLLLQVVVTELPQEDEMELALADSPSEMNIKRLAMAVEMLSSEQREFYEDLDTGILISRLDSGAGRRAGLQKGDVIVKINNQDVGDIQQFKQLVEDLPAGKSVPILVLRQSGPVFLAVRMPKE